MIQFMTPVRYEGYEKINRKQDASRTKQPTASVVYNIQLGGSEVRVERGEW